MATSSTRTEVNLAQYQLLYSNGLQETITSQTFFSSLDDSSIRPVVDKWKNSEYFSLNQTCPNSTVFVNSSNLLALICVRDGGIHGRDHEGQPFTTQVLISFPNIPKSRFILEKTSTDDVCRRIEEMTQRQNFFAFSDGIYRTILFPKKAAQKMLVTGVPRSTDFGEYFSISGGRF